MKLFSGTSNPSLANQVAKLLNTNIAKSSTVFFSNSEVRVRIEEIVKDETCVVIQSTSNPTDTHLMELFFFADALRREEAGKIIAFIPYFGYARQDIQHRTGECVSSNVIARFLETIGFAKIYTFDIHDEATAGIFSIPFKNVSLMPLLAEKIKKYLDTQYHINPDPKQVIIISSDQGAIDKVRSFGIAFYGTDKFDLGLVEKKRDQEHIHKAQPYEIYGDVKDKIVILVDDIITTGSTLLPPADIVLNRGAKKVIAAVVHPDFSADAVTKIQNSVIDRIFTTNSILIKPEQKFDKLTEINCAPVIAKELSNLRG